VVSKPIQLCYTAYFERESCWIQASSAMAANTPSVDTPFRSQPTVGSMAGEAAEDTQLPAYSEMAPVSAPSEDKEQAQDAIPPPSYAGPSVPEAVIPLATPATHLAKVTFPKVIKCYANFKQCKTLGLCEGSADMDDRLFTIEIHTGFSGKLPLGAHVGLLLHAGPGLDTPLIGAVGEVSDAGARPYAFVLESNLFLPALKSSRQDFVTRPGFVTEKMRGYTAANGEVAFRFTVEVGREGEKFRREEFEWQRLQPKVDERAPDGGFKLVQILGRPGDHIASPNGESSTETSHPENVRSSRHLQEVLAIQAFRAVVKTWNHAWTLTRLVTDDRAAELGQRWMLAVTLTAMRLNTLRLQGRVDRKHVKVGEKIRVQPAIE
jgi:hypothetical protein